MDYMSIFIFILCLLLPCYLLISMERRPMNLHQFMLMVAAIFLAVGFLENITYFVDYLPHKQQYTIVDGRFDVLPLGYYKNKTAYACFQLNGKSYGHIPIHIGFFETSDTKVRFGVRMFPSGIVTAVRIQPVLDEGTLVAVIWEIWGLLMYLLKPAWEDE